MTSEFLETDIGEVLARQFKPVDNKDVQLVRYSDRFLEPVGEGFHLHVIELDTMMGGAFRTWQDARCILSALQVAARGHDARPRLCQRLGKRRAQPTRSPGNQS